MYLGDDVLAGPPVFPAGATSADRRPHILNASPFGSFLHHPFTCPTHLIDILCLPLFTPFKYYSFAYPVRG